MSAIGPILGNLSRAHLACSVPLLFRQTSRGVSTSLKNRISSDNNQKPGRAQSIRTIAPDPLSSVIAYNLSEKLQLENAHRLLRGLVEYRTLSLPEDMQSEAIILSLKIDNFDYPATNSQNADLMNNVLLLREGSIVFWGVPYDYQKRILHGLASLKINPHTNDIIQDERDYIAYALSHSSEKSRLEHDTLLLAINQPPESIRLDQFATSHAVALSVKLGVWEATLDQYIKSVSWVTDSMRRGENIQLTRDQVFRKTGEIYSLKHRINLSSDLLDLPDVYWDRHNQEVLFLSLTSFLNLRKRTAVMNEKLNNCCELMNLLAGHMNDKHHVRLEWMIIILILVEVLFEVFRFL